jgi:hypothetical protein
MDVLNRLGGLSVPTIVGPANDAQQQSGIISAMAAGLPRPDLYSPLQWSRVQLRCLGPTLDVVDDVSQNVYIFLHTLGNRTVGHMASTDKDYLIHVMNPSAGPSQHFTSPETWEALIFIEMMIGTDPIEV